MNIKDLKEALVSRRKKDWPKGSIDTDDKKMKLAKDLIDLEKQGAPRWTVDQLRKKRPRNEQKTFKQFQNDAKGLTDKQFGKLLDKKGIKRPDVLKKVKEEKKPFPHEKVARKQASLRDKMYSKAYGSKRSNEKNRSWKIDGIEDAVRRGEDPRKDTRGGAFAKQGNPDHDHRADYSNNRRKRRVKPAGVKEAVKRDEYGDPIGGPKISKKKRKKNLSTYEGDDKNV